MSAKSIVQCGTCKAKFRVAAKLIGRIARCPHCRHRFVLAPKHTLNDSALDWLLEDGDPDDLSPPQRSPAEDASAGHEPPVALHHSTPKTGT